MTFEAVVGPGRVGVTHTGQSDGPGFDQGEEFS
jgi:hypothetical protein